MPSSLPFQSLQVRLGGRLKKPCSWFAFRCQKQTQGMLLSGGPRNIGPAGSAGAGRRASHATECGAGADVSLPNSVHVHTAGRSSHYHPGWGGYQLNSLLLWLWGPPVPACGSEVDLPTRALWVCSIPDTWPGEKPNAYVRSSRNNKFTIQ